MRFGVLDVDVQENMTLRSAGEAIICSIVSCLSTVARLSLTVFLASGWTRELMIMQ
jgi:hypothetical protein